MRRSRVVAIGIALLGLLGGWVLVEALAGRVEDRTAPIVETAGFAVSTPAAIVLTTFLTRVFAFDRYFAERSRAALVGDFVLAVLAAGIVGLGASSLADRVADSPTATFVVAAILTFVAAFVTFLLRTRPYQDWSPDAS